jgi:hypothetical protein
MATDTEVTKDKMEVTWDEPQVTRPGRPKGRLGSKYDAVIRRAEEEADKETRPVVITGIAVEAGPWVKYPTDGTLVIDDTRHKLRRQWGPRSLYRSNNDGNYFQVELVDRQRKKLGSGSWQVKGVLQVRKVIVNKAAEK